MENLVDLYTDYLLVCSGLASSTFLSSVLDNKISHDKFTRLLGSGKLNSRFLWHSVKPMCKEVENDDAVLVIDDSVEAKPHSQCNGLVQYHFDHTVNRFVKGINFVTALYHGGGASIPVGAEFVVKDEMHVSKDGKIEYKSSKSKHEMFRGLVSSAAERLRFRYVLADSWFASADNMDFIDGNEGYFIMAMKSNRKVALSWEDKLSGKYTSIEEAVMEGCASSVYVEQLDFPLLITKQVFKNGDGSTGTLYLCTNDTSLSYEQITAIYQKRWKVEEYHKSIKSNCCFPKSPTSSLEAQKAHFIASLLAYFKLEQLKVSHNKNHFALKAIIFRKATIAAWEELKVLKSQKHTIVNKAA
jgi:hypothetical protein